MNEISPRTGETLAGAMQRERDGAESTMHRLSRLLRECDDERLRYREALQAVVDEGPPLHFWESQHAAELVRSALEGKR